MSIHTLADEVSAAIIAANKAKEESGTGTEAPSKTYLGGISPDEYYPGQDKTVPGSKYGYGSGAAVPTAEEQETYGEDQYRRQYITGDGAQMVGGWSPERLSAYEELMLDAGLLTPGSYTPGQMGREQIDGWEYVLGEANYFGLSPQSMIQRLARLGRNTPRGGGGGGRGRSTAYTIPDYDTLAQNAKNMLRQTVGREINDWEMSLVADELQKNYRKKATQLQAAQLAGSGEFEVTDPQTVTQAFVEDQYSDEISRISGIQENTFNNQLALKTFMQGAGAVPGQ